MGYITNPLASASKNKFQLSAEKANLDIVDDHISYVVRWENRQPSKS